MKTKPKILLKLSICSFHFNQTTPLRLNRDSLQTTFHNFADLQNRRIDLPEILIEAKILGCPKSFFRFIS